MVVFQLKLKYLPLFPFKPQHLKKKVKKLIKSTKSKAVGFYLIKFTIVIYK